MSTPQAASVNKGGEILLTFRIIKTAVPSYPLLMSPGR